MAERYIKFKIECPKTITKKKDQEIYRKLEYLGPVDEQGNVTKKYFRSSIKQKWQRFMDSNEFLQERDDIRDGKRPKLTIKDVTILEDMDQNQYLQKYFEYIFI